MSEDLTEAQKQILRQYAIDTFTMGHRNSEDRTVLVFKGYLRWAGDLWGEQHYALTELGEQYRNRDPRPQ